MDVNSLRTIYQNIGIKLFYEKTKTGESFRSQLLSMYLTRTQPCVTMRDNGQIYVYDFNKGDYKENGKTYLVELIREILREKYVNHTAEEVINHIKVMTYKDRDDFKLPLNLIPTRNGIIEIPVDAGGKWDFSKKRLVKNSPEHFVVNRLPISYDPSAKCPRWIKFIEEIFHPDDIKLIQEYVGYCLYRDFIYHKVLMLVGPTRTGKSTFLFILTSLLGKSNVVSIPLHDLSEKFQRVRIYLKLANILADLSKKQMKDTSIFKQMTGRDLISARRLYENSFEFIPYSKYAWSCNEIPPVEEDDPAFFIRWKITTVNKKQYFDGAKGTDNRLSYKLVLELSGILNWALDGLQRLMEQGYFTNDDDWETTKRLWWVHSDTLGAFMYSDLISFSSDGYIYKDKFYALFCDYCEMHGASAWSKEKIGREISKRFKNQITTGYKGSAGEQKKTWEGIQEKIDVDDIPQSEIDSLFEALQEEI